LHKATISMPRSRYKTVKTGKTYFATSATVNWLPVFAIPELAEIVLDSFRFMHTEKRIIFHAYILMENHFHLIGSSAEFSDEMRKLKSFTARKVVDYLEANCPKFFIEQFEFLKKSYKTDQTYQVWQEGFHPKMIIDHNMLIQKIEYIHYNPVKRGYIDKPEHWRYSSYRNYFGGGGLVPIEKIV